MNWEIQILKTKALFIIKKLEKYKNEKNCESTSFTTKSLFYQRV